MTVITVFLSSLRGKKNCGEMNDVLPKHLLTKSNYLIMRLHRRYWHFIKNKDYQGSPQ